MSESRKVKRSDYLRIRGAPADERVRSGDFPSMTSKLEGPRKRESRREEVNSVQSDLVNVSTSTLQCFNNPPVKLV